MRIKGKIALGGGFRYYIALIPLINMLFVLVIFIMLFFVSSSQPVIKVNLPKILTSDKVKTTTIEILISQNGTLYFNNKIITLSEIDVLFKDVVAHNQSVLIKADRCSPLGKSVEVWDKARNLGITQINTLTN